MRTTILTLLILLIPATVRAQEVAGQARNRFLGSNPGYRERAGAFYEKEYLPHAAVALSRAADQPRFTENEASRVLRLFLYEWLDAYIDGGGAISNTDHARILKKLDERMRSALDDNNAFARYLVWRQSQGDNNPLAFLMRSPEQ